MPESVTKESLQFKSPEEEIDFLRAEIEKKEQKLRESKIHEPEAHIQTAKEEIAAYQKRPHAEVLAPEYVIPETELKSIVLDLAPEEHDEKMGELLTVLQEKGIKNTLSVVEHMKNPHLEDDFHRFLVEYIKEEFPVRGLKEKGPLWKALHMTLYEVALPGKNGEEEGRQKPLKELLSGMEQFYAGMLSVSGKDERGNPHFTIEISLQDKSDEIVFYSAVPNHKRDLFEKQILSIFPNARILEQNNDYNVFVEGGHSVGSYANLSRKPIFPLKTYDAFDYDPLNIVLNTFSKIEKDGGGAAIQIVFSPSGDSHLAEYKSVLRRLHKGEPLRKALKGVDVSGAFFKTVGEIFTGVSKKKDTEKQPPDQLTIENIQNKTASQIVTSNIRLLASATTKNRAEDILSDIESAFNQLENTHGNKLSFTRLSGGKLPSFFKDFSFRDYREKYALPLNLKELATILHFPLGEAVSSPQLKESKAGTAPAPTDAPQTGILLGINHFRNLEKKIYLTKEDRLRHLYVVGQTGTGKTALLKNMIVQDIEAGEGVCMIDPHGNDIEDVLGMIPQERFKDVIYFDPAYTPRVMGLNMLEYDPERPEQKTFVVNE
ncbi:MAG: hypothetical protein HYT27_02450, partial [Parcubacteria group bacterium]|nr:hypothetical protein [Parcubacteria group bacterium]